MPAAYPLAGLLTLRNLREENAARAVSAAEAGARAAEKQRAEQARTLAEYRAFRLAETERRYQAVIGQILSRPELEDFKTGLARLDARELAETEKLKEAEEALARALETTEAARQAWRGADKARQKLLVHKDEWMIAERLEAERQEDKELEEFKPLVFTDAEGIQ